MTKLTNPERRELMKIISDNAAKESKNVIADCPGWKEAVEAKSRKVAIGHLGIEKDLVKLDLLRKQASEFTEKAQELESSIEKQLPKGEPNRYDTCPTHITICKAINQIVDRVYEAVKFKNPIGKKLVQIETKRDKKITQLMECVTREEVTSSTCLRW